jgi:hypothetical protein
MTTMLAHVHKPCAIRQQIKAGSQFDGLAPADGATALDPAASLDYFNFDPGTHGGLFDPTASYYSFYERDALNLLGMDFKSGGQSSWSLSLVDKFGTEYVIWSGTTGDTVQGPSAASGPVILIWGTKLKFVTVGASAAMVCTIKLGPQEWCIEDSDRAV